MDACNNNDKNVPKMSPFNLRQISVGAFKNNAGSQIAENSKFYGLCFFLN